MLDKIVKTIELGVITVGTLTTFGNFAFAGEYCDPNLGPPIENLRKNINMGCTSLSEKWMHPNVEIYACPSDKGKLVLNAYVIGTGKSVKKVATIPQKRNACIEIEEKNLYLLGDVVNGIKHSPYSDKE
ncbi:MAG: hypothetical protein OQK82_05735 [Candidatus Pacearchaeota archaeon]|nr:hypothetical protein [Candidatus Pacearchaeota archaeon]